MFITFITKVPILNQPNLIQTCISYLCKILFNRYVLLRLCLGLLCGLFHFATLCLWATCATSYLFNLTCSWRMKNVKLFSILNVTVQQSVTIFLYFLSFCSKENFCWMLLPSSTSHHACALNRSCVEEGDTVFKGSITAVLRNGELFWSVMELSDSWQAGCVTADIFCEPPCIMSCCECCECLWAR